METLLEKLNIIMAHIMIIKIDNKEKELFNLNWKFLFQLFTFL